MTAVIPRISATALGFSICAYLASFFLQNGISIDVETDQFCECMALNDLLHNLVHKITDILEDIVQEFDSAFTSRHAQNHTEVDMRTLLAKFFETHKLDDLEELLQVEILLRCYNVDHGIKVIFSLSLLHLGDVSCKVKGSSILLFDDRLL